MKALRELRVKGLRVDKINHNEKIDLKILDLINQPNFGIADLTFARPSVYFEAGILEGQNKPVVFLSREDHFNPILDDPHGNFRIHFDLITLNIIP
jgi:nucleoside 2-deoxyribosyltransferase